VAHSLSSKKRIRQNQTRRARNRARRSILKGHLLACRAELQHGTPESASPFVLRAFKALDQAAVRGTIHRNAAARRKSRLAKRFKTLRQKQAT
jgi:small subunit ribosomal protein S20